MPYLVNNARVVELSSYDELKERISSKFLGIYWSMMYSYIRSFKSKELSKFGCMLDKILCCWRLSSLIFLSSWFGFCFLWVSVWVSRFSRFVVWVLFFVISGFQGRRLWVWLCRYASSPFSLSFIFFWFCICYFAWCLVFGWWENVGKHRDFLGLLIFFGFVNFFFFVCFLRK